MPAFAWIKARKKCGQKPHRNKRTNDMNKRTKYMHDTKERDICVLFGIIVDNVDNTFVCVLLLSYEKPVVQANNYIDHDVRRTKRRSTLIFNKNRFPSPKISISFFVIYLFYACSQCLLLETIFVVSLSCFISIPENRQFFSTSFDIFFCLFI